MRDQPIFDSTRTPDATVLTDEEAAAVKEGMRRLAEFRAIENDIPDLDARRPTRP